ncbi:sigma-70 family RNA polymerase sigma factor [Roseateles flavus]|uniref:Sigma-70 family RNA polymerase sigma factor n=1 Tax=Roseateles flavus TaxID=3149041 RepID=A0ABV0GGJ2_9BURK
MKTAEPSGNELDTVFIARRNELRGVAFRLVESAELVEDVLQDAYLKLIRRGPRREVKNPFGYCCQVVRNTALDHSRRRATELRCIVPSPDGELPDTQGALPASAGLDQRRAIARADSLLATVPERARWAFERHRLYGLSQREIAVELGVSATLVNFMVKDVMVVLSGVRDALGD